jgi:4-amino-4-deoxy-L-arabinose transferase-like glycosyltransferase
VIARIDLSTIKDVIKFLGSERMRWLALTLTALLFLFARAPSTRLTTDPVLYAAIARTMADSGDYLNLKLGEEPYYKKPPLQFWLAAASIKTLGPNVLAVSLFSRLFGLGCVLLTAWLGTRLYGPKVGWVAGLALTTTYIFFRGTGTFRLDSGLTFGILLAIYGYFSSSKNWGSPVFFLGVAIAILSKGLPGVLPLLVVPAHAFFSSRVGSSSPRAAWIAWSPLLLIPLSWWVYLLWADGAQPFHVLIDDLMKSNMGAPSRLHAFWRNYIELAFLNYYWPWLPFALFGTWLVVSELRDPEKESGRRASGALIMAWIAVAIVSSGLKNTQYPRYVFFALPAVSIITARGFMRFIGEKYLGWLQGSVAALAIAAAFIIACFSSTKVLKTNDQYYAIKQLLDGRLAPKSPVPMLKMKLNRGGTVQLSNTEKSAAIFFFARPVKLVSVDEVREASVKDRVTLLVRKDEIREISSVLPLERLFRGPDQLVVEVPRQP